MPFAHLKECPLDYNTPWRPAVVQQATASRNLLSDTVKARNAVQHYDPVERPEKPMGIESTIREAVRSGHYPSRHEVAQASLCTKGWKEFQTIRASQMASLKQGKPMPALLGKEDKALADLFGLKHETPGARERWTVPYNNAKYSGAPGIKTFKAVPGSDARTAAPVKSMPGLPPSHSAPALDQSTASRSRAWNSAALQMPLEHSHTIAAGGTIGSRGFKSFPQRPSQSLPLADDAAGRLKGVHKGHFGGMTMWSIEGGPHTFAEA
eukprot:TRINITY_DN91682_c0_g1_i1.p1 TRINITY_DN91682_c0_g1~~TRINITY_DN91682_c0_g1_i1.p1  ORF type:complete len:266 (-),score=57.73 TRINITY_DN91682_c0_g1_i1:99-896(-)